MFERIDEDKLTVTTFKAVIEILHNVTIIPDSAFELLDKFMQNVSFEGIDNIELSAALSTKRRIMKELLATAKETRNKIQPLMKEAEEAENLITLHYPELIYNALFKQERDADNV